MGKSSHRERMMERSNYGVQEQVKIPLHLPGIQVRPSPVRFHLTAEYSPQGQEITQSNCGMFRREKISTRLKGIHIRSNPLRFPATEQPSLQGAHMTSSGCGMSRREKISLHFHGIHGLSPLWRSPPTGGPRHRMVGSFAQAVADNPVDPFVKGEDRREYCYIYRAYG